MKTAPRFYLNANYQVVATDMFAREQILNYQIPQEDRFSYFAVNVCFFNIVSTEDMLEDILGMSTLYLPDPQYHFHGMDPNWVVNHAYNLLSYMYADYAPIKSGETVDGVVDGTWIKLYSGNASMKCFDPACQRGT